jgi:hypothetical protein
MRKLINLADDNSTLKIKCNVVVVKYFTQVRGDVNFMVFLRSSVLLGTTVFIRALKI